MIGPDVTFKVTIPVVMVPAGSIPPPPDLSAQPIAPDQADRLCDLPNNSLYRIGLATVAVTQIKCQGVWTTTAWSAAPAMYVQAEARSPEEAQLQLGMMQTVRFTVWIPDPAGSVPATRLPPG